MRYDLKLIDELCGELGLPTHFRDEQCVDIDLGPAGVLCFQNAVNEKDSLIGFRESPWHTHGDLTFMDRRGNYIELDYLDLLTGLADGRILVCDRLQHGELMERWPIHRDYNHVFRYMDVGEQIVVRRATTRVVPTGQPGLRQSNP